MMKMFNNLIKIHKKKEIYLHLNYEFSKKKNEPFVLKQFLFRNRKKNYKENYVFKRQIP